MIPKIIHYCWFGGNPLPDDVKKYIITWKKYCPDYEIKQWDESNFNINSNDYCREAYEAKKWAFVTDYVRLKVLYDYGGFYMDTDVEVCKPLDDLRQYAALSGYESPAHIPTGTMGACRDNAWIGFLLSYYDRAHFLKPDGTYDMTTNVETITRMTKEKYGLTLDGKFQIFDSNNSLLPFDYLCAKSWKSGRLMTTKNTYTIHHFNGSWLSEESKLYNKYYHALIRYFPELIAANLAKAVAAYHTGGVRNVGEKVLKKLL